MANMINQFPFLDNTSFCIKEQYIFSAWHTWLYTICFHWLKRSGCDKSTFYSVFSSLNSLQLFVSLFLCLPKLCLNCFVLFPICTFHKSLVGLIMVKMSNTAMLILRLAHITGNVVGTWSGDMPLCVYSWDAFCRDSQVICTTLKPLFSLICLFLF